MQSHAVDAKLQVCKGEGRLQGALPALQRGTEIPGMHTQRVWYKPVLVLHVLEWNMEFKLQRFHKRCSQKCAEWKLWNVLGNIQSPMYKPNFNLRHRLTELFCTWRKTEAKESDIDALLQSHLASQPFRHYSLPENQPDKERAHIFLIKRNFCFVILR